MASRDEARSLKAANDLFRTHRQDLVFLARSMVGCPAVAEDIVQDAFAVYASKAGEEAILRPFNYLFGTVRNLALMHLRKRAREDRFIIPYASCHGVESISTPGESPEQIVASRQQLKLFKEALTQLPSKMQRAVRLYLVEGVSIRSVAAELNISIGKAHALVKDGLAECERRVLDGNR